MTQADTTKSLQPRQSPDDPLASIIAALEGMREPTEEMVAAGDNPLETHGVNWVQVDAEWVWREMIAASALPSIIAELRALRGAPIPMVLFCPACGLQHIDAPEWREERRPGPNDLAIRPTWTNPPHRSHLCHGCGHIWRPADVPTEGVAAIQTCGKADSSLPSPPLHDPEAGEG